MNTRRAVQLGINSPAPPSRTSGAMSPGALQKPSASSLRVPKVARSVGSRFTAGCCGLLASMTSPNSQAVSVMSVHNWNFLTLPNQPAVSAGLNRLK